MPGNRVSSCLCRVDGGISNNDFVLELMSSLTCQTIDRPSQTDMSTLGAAFLAGLATGTFGSFSFELSYHSITSKQVSQVHKY